MGVPPSNPNDLVSLFEAVFGEELTENDRMNLSEIGLYPPADIAAVLEEARAKKLSLSLAYARVLLRKYSVPVSGGHHKEGGAPCQ